MALNFCRQGAFSLNLGILILLIFSPALAQKLTVVNLPEEDPQPHDPPKILTFTSNDYDYQQKNLDIIWNIPYPAKIIFSTLDIDGQAGDFIVVCEYPLPQGEQFSDGAPAEEAVNELPIEDSLLITSNALDVDSEGRKRLEVHVRSKHGGFVYFHGTKQTQSISDQTSHVTKKNEVTAEGFEGFLFQVQFLELEPTPEVSTTTERLIGDVYLVKKVIGRTPTEFYRNLTQFKERVAVMGNGYCEKQHILLWSNRSIAIDDVRLDNTTIFFCDPAKIIQHQICVQIQLAITVRDIDNNYVFTKTKLEEMWCSFAEGVLNSTQGKPMAPLEKPCDHPDDEKTEFVTWVWVASSLGVVLTLATMLCFVYAGGLIKSTHEPVSTTAGMGRKNSTGSSFADPNNTVLKDIIDDLFSKRTNDDAELMGMGDTGTRSYRSSSSNPKRNPLQNLKSFDNPAFIHDENRGSFRSSGYYPSKQSGSGSSSHHAFQFQVHNHAVPGLNDDSDEELEFYAPSIAR